MQQQLKIDNQTVTDNQTENTTGLPGSSEFVSSEDQIQSTVPWKLIVLPVVAFIFINICTPFLFYWDQIRYRPWITLPLFICLNVFVSVISLIYGLRISVNYRFRPFFPTTSTKHCIVEIFKSLGFVFLINIGISIPVLFFMSLIDVQPQEHTYVQIMYQVPGSWIIICGLILMFTIIPLIEEIFFRGFLYNALKTKFILPTACFIQALLFALCHPYGILGKFSMFLFAIALALIYDRTRTLLRPVFIHSIKNAFLVIPLLILVAGNLHSPANSYVEGFIRPNWLLRSPPEYIERKGTASEQLGYAKKTWGTMGARQWKKEINAFSAVTTWFPEDRDSVSEAMLAIVAVYHHQLGDHWRAIVTAEKLQAEFGDQPDECASSMEYQGWAYYRLKQFGKSRDVFTKLIELYPDNSKTVKAAQQGLKWLDIVS